MRDRVVESLPKVAAWLLLLGSVPARAPAQSLELADIVRFTASSTAVVTGIVEKEFFCVRPDRLSTVFRDEGAGESSVELIRAAGYDAGWVFSLRVQQLLKPDGSARVGGAIEVFIDAEARFLLRKGARYVLFLTAPARSASGESLEGTVLTTPWAPMEPVAFQFGLAYSLFGGERIAVDLASYGEEAAARLAAQVESATYPRASMVAPGPGVITGATTLSAKAVDDDAVTSVRFEVDGIALPEERKTFPYEILLETATLSNGPHSVVAVARDAMGREARSSPVELTVSNFPATYTALYSAWTCTKGGANGCSRTLVSYAPATYKVDPPAAPAPPSVEYAPGYIAGYTVGPWRGCSASCGGGTQTRTVTPSSWKPAPPNAAAPPSKRACNTQPCAPTCASYGLYVSRPACLAAGWAVCEIRYRDDGVGGLLTCWKGFP